VRESIPNSRRERHLLGFQRTPAIEKERLDQTRKVMD